MNEIDGIPSVTHASGAEIVKAEEERRQRYLKMIDEANTKNQELLKSGGERLGYLIGEGDNRFFVYDKPLPSEEMYDELGQGRSEAWYGTAEYAQASVVRTRNNYLMITPDGYRLVG